MTKKQEKAFKCARCKNDQAWHARAYAQIESTVGRAAADDFDYAHYNELEEDLG